MRRLELDDETMQQLCDNLPASYVLNTPLATVATHLKFLEQLPQEKLIVDFYQPPRDPYTEMSIIAYDDETPGLLSKICGAVYVAGLSIHQAQVFTLSAGEGALGAGRWALERRASTRRTKAPPKPAAD